MNCSRYFLTLVLLAVIPLPLSAGILFGKKAGKPDPKDRVPELLGVIKNDKDEHKRAAAATELKQYDSTVFPEIQVILIDVLLSDAKSSVRAEAADSLSKLRPVSKNAGWALEQALAKDSSMRVRMQARYSLLQYHWAGYHSTSKDAPPLEAKESKEPPLVATEPRTPIAVTPVKKKSVKKTSDKETPPPPLAPVEVGPPNPRPLPQGTVQPPLTPVDPPSLKSVSKPAGNEGPDLNSPE